MTTPELNEFMAEFSRLATYDGPAYRAAKVTPEGSARLRGGNGDIVIDAGVQSASTQAINANGWHETWAPSQGPTQATQSVMYIFDESITKKNMSTGFLPDHVAIPPGTPLKVVDTKMHEGMLYVYFTAPTKVPNHVYRMFDGERVY